MAVKGDRDRQIAVGFVALLSILGMLTRDPLLLLGFTVAQGLILLGVVLFVVVAIFSQRTMVLEDFGPGEVIFHEGDPGRHVYVIRSGNVEVLAKRPDGSREVFARLYPGDHFGELPRGLRSKRSALFALSAGMSPAFGHP